MALVLSACAAGAIAFDVAAPVSRIASDAMLRLAADRPPTPPAAMPDAVLVAIDPQSLRALPDWPWSRGLHARAVRRLHAAGAKAIVFDVDFSTRRGDVADGELVSAALDSGIVVLAAFRQLQELPGGAVLEVANTPFPALARAAAGVGSVHMEVDPDGVLRRSPRISEIRGDRVGSLSETALRVATGLGPGERTTIGPAEDSGVASLAAAHETAVPVDYRRAAPPVPVISMVDVIEGRFDPRDVAGRVVLVGATAAEFQDLWATPLGPARPGVWIQAVAYRTAAARQAGDSVLRRATTGEQIAAVVGLLAVAMVFGRGSDRGHARRSAALLGLGLAFVAGSQWLLVTQGVLVDPVVPASALALQHVVGLERVRRRFGARIAVGEQSISALAQVGAATSTPAAGDAGLGVALALLGDVVDASGVALLRADPSGALDGRRLDWKRRGDGTIADLDAAAASLEAREPRIYVGERPGSPGRPGAAVYTPLHAGDRAIGVLVVERDRGEALDVVQLRTVATVATQLTLSAHNLALLEDLRTTFDSSIEAIASAVEARDGYTEQHCRRLAAFSTLMAQRLGLDEDEIEAIRLGALLHDVGKVGIRDEILLKPGRFTPPERSEMESHAVIGHGIISGVHGLRATTLACVRHHHERWDGGGYPDGLRGEEIPLGARIVAVVDVWDALSTARPYKPALPRERVRELLRKDRGSHFDARLVDLFLELLDDEGEDLLVWIGRASDAER